jgi:uncharacterized protein YciI
MRIPLLLSALLTLAACATAPPAPATGYDAALAQRLGADERGMKMYVLVVLKTGPNTTATDEEKKRLFEGHFANISRLANEGKLAVAGPFGANDRQWRGLYIFNVATVAEALELTRTDPAVAAGIFTVEATPWYGSAALMETTAIHKRLELPK